MAARITRNGIIPSGLTLTRFKARRESRERLQPVEAAEEPGNASGLDGFLVPERSRATVSKFV